MLTGWNTLLSGQEYIFQYVHYGIEEGLPHREVNAIHQCSRGFVWVSTPQGLSRFDGRQFTTFNSRTDHFQHDNIWRILEDADGWFWLLPQPPYQDFDIWNPVTRELTSFLKKFGKNQTLPASHPTGWVTSANDTTLLTKLDAHTLFSYHPDRGIQTIKLQDVALFNFEQRTHFGRSVIAADESIWLMTATDEVVEIDWKGAVLQRLPKVGEIQFNRSLHSHAFPFIYFEWSDRASVKKKSFMVGRNGQHIPLADPLWFPSILPGADLPAIGEDLLYDDNTFYRLDGTPIYTLPGEPWNESTSNFRAMYLTPQGDIWMGEDFGLRKVSFRKNIFKNYLTGAGKDLNAIRGIVADGQRAVFNVEHLGPFICNRATGQARQPKIPGEEFGAYSIHHLQDGRIFFGKGRALGMLDKDGSFAGFHDTGRYSWAIFETDKKTLWLGTDSGLHIFDLEKNEARPFEKYNGFNDLRSAVITHIAASRDGHLWLCTNKGFFQADRERGILAQYSKNGEGHFKIPHDVIHHFYEDTDPKGAGSTFWLASGGGGLIQFAGAEREDAQFPNSPVSQFTTLDGLSNDVVYAVYPDGFGNLWLSSDQGIMRFNKKTKEVRTFLAADGLPNNEFNRLAHYQSEDGELFFGTINGAVSFRPAELEGIAEENDPPLRITAYHQFDGEKNRMVERTVELAEKGEITLRPDDRFFTIELALLNYQEVSKTRFAYRFKGLGDEWEYSSERSLRFGRLPYGNYELQIKAQDARGHWSASELHIPVTVLRPFYLQTWFIVLAIAAVLAGAFLFYKIRTRQLKERQRELEKIVAERTQKIQQDKAVIEKQAEELQSLEKLKSRFFANVSHELRTPLSLMIGPLDSILKKESDRPEKEQRLLEFVSNNSKHLLKLVNEILDLSKLETGRMEVKEEAVNLHDFLQPIMSQFSSFGDSESVKMQFDFQADPGLNLMLDANKFEKIVHNFLSNAIKFSPAGAVVKLKVEATDGNLLVSVTDQGPGIHPDDLPHIFDRFYQSKLLEAPTQGGTGIGLSLAAELAELLGGKVWAESEWGRGSVFYFRFPVKKVDSPQSAVISPQSSKSETKLPTADCRTAELKPTILIVEDNPELRSYMQLLLEDEYHVITAENGKVGWEVLNGEWRMGNGEWGMENGEWRMENEGVSGNSQFSILNSPFKIDLIISDLMMPIMDGFQLLEKIKSHETLRHLPVIMLTARADVRVKLRALRIGVDDYLTKPFVEEELQVRIKNLLHNYRERVKALAEKDHVEEPLLPEKPDMAAGDTKWLEQVEAVFSKILSDSQFKIDWVAGQVHLSERQFDRRLKQLTGLTPNNYLREMRLQRAKDFLHEGKYTSVKEVGFAVGFSSTKYFSGLFQERFGVLPSTYLS